MTAHWGALAVAAASAVTLARQTPQPVALPPPSEIIVREVRLVALFDKNGDRRLDARERDAARDYLKAHPQLRPPLRRTRLTAGTPGPTIRPADVRSYPDRPLYDAATLRTLFLDFESGSWEQDLTDFHGTDVELPATLTVDGRTYPGVGVHFRGHNSFLAVPAGRKRQLTVSLDFTDPAQRLLGYRGLHLLNAFTDASFMRGVLYLDIAREYIAAPKANFVEVVINGESWGVYVNQQRFDSDFLRDAFRTTRGARWRSLNNAPGGGLAYLGEDLAPYYDAYEIKSKEDPQAWEALKNLTRVLHATPPDTLAAALDPILDVEGTLRWLALDNVLMNGDGYWEDGSDYNLYLDPRGRFHLVPYDVNEAFRPVGGGRGGGGPAATLDPLFKSDDPRWALLHRMMAAADLRERYLRHVRTIAAKCLEWKTLGPRVSQYEALISAAVARDTRKLYTTDDFTAALQKSAASGGLLPPTTLRGFAERRRIHLLSRSEIKKLR